MKSTISKMKTTLDKLTVNQDERKSRRPEDTAKELLTLKHREKEKEQIFASS